MVDHIIKSYQLAFEKNGVSPEAVLWPKGRQYERFSALLSHVKNNQPGSLLDFGCGLAHMIEYVNQMFPYLEYTGADIVPDFIKSNLERFPDSSFKLIKDATDITNVYDYIVASGTFNMLYVKDSATHQQIVFDYLTHLFSITRVYLSVNFMTDKVDYIQDGAFHQNVNTLLDFVQSKLSMRIVVDHSYMPFEYTITIFKDQEIVRPQNTYHL